MKQRLDKELVARGLAPTRSQAEDLVRLGEVTVDGQVATKSGQMVTDSSLVKVASKQRYVSRAGLKLASVVNKFGVQFRGKVVLDVGSSTGGFTDYALRAGAQKVIAIDVGTDQMHPSLRSHPGVELHEKTDMRDYVPVSDSEPIDIVLIDVSFISLRQILPHIAKITDSHTSILAMVKPQFEAGKNQLTRGGIVKNDRHRREILADFEVWSRRYFAIKAKADSEVAGAGGNLERFYLLSNLPK